MDNGRVCGEVLWSGLVEHVRADGTLPDRPGRVAALVACWLGERWRERCLFNLRLPMKRRIEALCHAS